VIRLGKRTDREQAWAERKKWARVLSISRKRRFGQVKSKRIGQRGKDERIGQKKENWAGELGLQNVLRSSPIDFWPDPFSKEKTKKKKGEHFLGQGKYSFSLAFGQFFLHCEGRRERLFLLTSLAYAEVGERYSERGLYSTYRGVHLLLYLS